MNDAPADPAQRDYRDTVFLPQTSFPMRGDLPKREPLILARWEQMDLWSRLRAASRGRPKFILHDGPPYANGTQQNGTALNKKIAAPAGRIETMLKAKKSTAELLDELYLAALGRMPQADERQRVLGWIERAPNPREGVQDLLWVLLNSREFLFNH